MKTGGEDVDHGGGRELRRFVKVSEDQKAAPEASFHATERQMKKRWRREVEEGSGEDADKQLRVGRTTSRGQDESEG